LIKLIADTRHWFELLSSGKANSIRDIASQIKVDENDVSRFLSLAFLAPHIVETILAGNQPPELTVEKLKRLKSLPVSWEEQHQRLGIAP
jgi:site-specific DNA recombinase